MTDDVKTDGMTGGELIAKLLDTRDDGLLKPLSEWLMHDGTSTIDADRFGQMMTLIVELCVVSNDAFTMLLGSVLRQRLLHGKGGALAAFIEHLTQDGDRVH